MIKRIRHGQEARKLSKKKLRKLLIDNRIIPYKCLRFFMIKPRWWNRLNKLRVMPYEILKIYRSRSIKLWLRKIY